MYIQYIGTFGVLRVFCVSYIHTPPVMNILAVYVFFRLCVRLNYECYSFIFSVLASNEDEFSFYMFRIFYYSYLISFQPFCSLQGRYFCRLILRPNKMVSRDDYGLPSWPASKPLALPRLAVHAYSRIHCLWKRFAYKCLWKIALNRLCTICLHYTYICFVPLR